MINKNDAQAHNINMIDTQTTLTDAKQERIAQIKALLPNVINSDNQIDLKALQDLVGAENTTSNNQGYELTFAGKGLARAKADQETTKELKTELKQSKKFDTTDNVIIRGDNIDSLKILYKNYHNKIKMIYIDPPYNTKSENFIYKDNFKQSDSKLIKEFGLGEDTTNFLDNVYGTRSHSGWLAFMYPRLMLAKELLKEDGVIFISIDDNEQANLKIMCDEIFGEENFVGKIIHKNNSSKNQAKLLSISTEYLFCYTKSLEKLKTIEWKVKKKGARDIEKLFNQLKNKGLSLEEISSEIKDMYKRPKYAHLSRWNKIDEKGVFKDADLSREGGAKNYTIKNPHTGEDCIIPKRGWGKPYDELLRLQKENLIWYGDGTTPPRQYNYISSDSESVPDSFFYYDNSIDTRELKNTFGALVFENPKPKEMMMQLITMTQIKCNDLILDFFAGSGTTAHAVMQQNAEDGGTRKFILCQLDEAIDPNKSKPAYDFCIENGFEPVISSITIERVNRAGDKIKADNPDKNIDIGYKVFSHTEKPRIDYDDAQQSFHIVNQRAETIDTLINMLVATCKPLDTKIDTIRENAIYKADNEIYITGKITPEELEPFKDLKLNIDALADIDLKDYLNLDLSYQDNMTVIY